MCGWRICLRDFTFIIAIMLCSTAVLPAQEKQDDKSEVSLYNLRADLVALPVYVTYDDGRPVRGLFADDFEVREGRSVCRIVAAEFIDHMAESAAAYDTALPESRRQFLMLFDLNFVTPGGLTAARQAGFDFVSNSAAPGDLLAVATVSGRRGARLLCPFTANHNWVKAVLAEMGAKDALENEPGGFSMADIEDMIAFGTGEENEAEPTGPVDASLVSQIKSTDRRRYEAVVLGYFDALELMIRALQQIRGRKNIVLFSDGFNISAGAAMMNSVFNELLTEFRKAGAVVYAVNTQRLTAAGAGPLGQTNYAYTLFKFADDTNGAVFSNRNDLDIVLEEISQKTSAGYVLLFQP